MGTWLEGRSLAKKIKEDVKNEVERLKELNNTNPCLAGILVGENKASKVYVRTKEKNCQKVGIRSEILTFPEEMVPSDLIDCIKELNQRDDVDGILVQLPLPPQFNTHDIITSINPDKDVDGFHPYNLGNLMMNQKSLRPCTPLGIISLLKNNDISIQGKRIVIIGRSFIVGKPLAAMMTNEHGTVTICHSRTQDLPHVAAEADILVAAMGKGAFVTLDFVKEGATVIDVGINHLTDMAKVQELFGEDEKRLRDLEEKGYTIIGDVNPRVIEKAEYLTPVPGGVGPLTVAMLMQNTLEAYKKRHNVNHPA
ncbi:MAG: bifunctional methylenetetrahydrofolate dehydrogenase/methenyltetrahydrofolate cyclohydrolase FolD [Candidatus Aminicenantes bacterium]|nr:bifunctional methylenetetrahydrofolate dehydrogenase/methenyltetrahydrofolate cyclohydrolase FolD [Candidatus Aminicenantes bacterium]